MNEWKNVFRGMFLAGPWCEGPKAPPFFSDLSHLPGVSGWPGGLVAYEQEHLSLHLRQLQKRCGCCTGECCPLTFPAKKELPPLSPPLPPHPLQPSPAALLGFLGPREGAGHLASSRGPTGLWASLGTAKHVGGTGVMSSCGWQASVPPKCLTFLRPAYFISSSDPLVVRGPSVNSKPAGHFPKPRYPKHTREPASAVPCITL